MTPELAKSTALELRGMAQRLAELMDGLDTNSFPCDCCATIRYRNWQQNQLFTRLDGIADKLENSAAILDKGAHNREFLGEKAVELAGNDANQGHQR